MKLEPSTAKCEAELVAQSMEAFEEREKMLDHRAGILKAEFSRLAGSRKCAPASRRSTHINF